MFRYGMGATAARVTQGLQMAGEQLTDEERFALVPPGSVQAHCVALVSAVRAWMNCQDVIMGVHLEMAVVGLGYSLMRRCMAAYAHTLDVLDQRPDEQLRANLENLMISDSSKEFARRVHLCPDCAAPNAGAPN